MKNVFPLLVFLMITCFLISASLATAAEKGLVVYFSFEKEGGKTVKDDSGNGNDGDVNSPKRVASKDKAFGSAMEFDGVDDFIKISATDKLKVDTTISLLLWLKKAADNGGSGAFPRIISRAPNDAHELAIQAANGQLSYFFREIDGTWTNATPIDREWHHVALTYDGKAYRGYLDGKEVFSRNVTKNAVYQGDLYVGQRYNLNRESFGGLIDEFAVYNRVLAVAEIGDIMKTGVLQQTVVESTGKLSTTWGLLKKIL